MARTLPSAWSTEAGNDFGKPLLLIDLGLFVTRYLTSGDDGLSFNGQTYQDWLEEVQGGFGPELDWRGGLAAESPVVLKLIQAQSMLDGTAVNNTLERFYDAWAHNKYSGNQAESTFPNEGTAADSIARLVWDDGTPTVAESIKVFTGQIHDVRYADYGPLVVALGSQRDGYLSRLFVNRLGEEKSGDENYDTGREISPHGEGKAVPITYGTHTHAYGLFVHDDPTEDETVSSGLLVCYCDIRFKCDASSPQLLLYTYDAATDTYLEVQRNSKIGSSPGGSQTQWAYVTGTIPEGLGAGSGIYVQSKDTNDANEEPILSSAGNLIVERVLPLRKIHKYTNSTHPWGAGTNAVDGDDTTATNITSPASTRWMDLLVEEVSFPGTLFKIFLRCKVGNVFNTSSAIAHMAFKSGPGTWNALYRLTANAQNAANWSDPADQPLNEWNNWTGADDVYAIGTGRREGGSQGIPSDSPSALSDARVRIESTPSNATESFAIYVRAWWLLNHDRRDEATTLAKQARQHSPAAIADGLTRIVDAPKPLSAVPTLFSLNGFGLRVYGRRKRQPNGLYTTTRYVTAAFVPLVPIVGIALQPKTSP